MIWAVVLRREAEPASNASKGPTPIKFQAQGTVEQRITIPNGTLAFFLRACSRNVEILYEKWDEKTNEED